jgi:hypothetical protein
LDAGIRRWSGRLLVSGLAWGGCWLALGWPALGLGAALAIHAFLFTGERADRQTGEYSRVGLPIMQNYRRSLVWWWIIGLMSGTWWMWDAVRDHGLSATFAWLFDSTPNAISPLYPSAWEIERWGATIGLTFLLGWIVLGLRALVKNSSKVLAPVGDGRRIIILLWWAGLLICRTVTAAAGADPTLWDLLQTVPACLTAAIGMELVMQRALSALWLMGGISCGLMSLACHDLRLDSPKLDAAVGLGAFVLLMPLLINFIQTRSFHWGETRIRWALQGLLVSTWLAQLIWGVTQSIPASSAEVKFATQLARLDDSQPQPGAVIIVSQTTPPRSLEFLLRRQWPRIPVVAAERWETALSQTLSSVDDWADSQFLVVELTRRESQFRRPGAGWIVSTVGESRRYYGDQLTLHRVSVQSP